VPGDKSERIANLTNLTEAPARSATRSPRRRPGRPEVIVERALSGDDKTCVANLSQATHKPVVSSPRSRPPSCSRPSRGCWVRSTCWATLSTRFPVLDGSPGTCRPRPPARPARQPRPLCGPAVRDHARHDLTL